MFGGDHFELAIKRSLDTSVQWRYGKDGHSRIRGSSGVPQARSTRQRDVLTLELLKRLDHLSLRRIFLADQPLGWHGKCDPKEGESHGRENVVFWRR